MPIDRKTRLALSLIAASSVLYACGGGDVSPTSKDTADDAVISDKARAITPPGRPGGLPGWPPQRSNAPIDGTRDLNFAGQKDGVVMLDLSSYISVSNCPFTEMSQVIPLGPKDEGFLTMAAGNIVKINMYGEIQPFLEKSFADLKIFGSRMERLPDGSVIFTGVMQNFDVNITWNQKNTEKRAIKPNDIELPALVKKNVYVVGKLTPDGKIDVNFGKSGFYPLADAGTAKWSDYPISIRVLDDGGVVTAVNTAHSMFLTHLDATGKLGAQLGGKGYASYPQNPDEPKRSSFPAAPAGYSILPQMKNKNEIIMTGCYNQSVGADDAIHPVPLTEVFAIDLVGGGYFQNGVVGGYGRTGSRYGNELVDRCAKQYLPSYSAASIDTAGNMMIHSPRTLERFRGTDSGIQLDPTFDSMAIRKWVFDSGAYFNPAKFGVQPDGKVIAGTGLDRRTRFLANGAADTSGSYAAYAGTKFPRWEDERTVQAMVPMPGWNYEFSTTNEYVTKDSNGADTLVPERLHVQRQYAPSLCPKDQSVPSSLGGSRGFIPSGSRVALADVAPSTTHVSPPTYFGSDLGTEPVALWLWSGEWSKDDGKTWSNTHGMVKAGDMVRFRILSSQTPGATASVRVSVGCGPIINGQWEVTTRK